MLMNPMIIVISAIVVVGITGAVMYAIAAKHDRDHPAPH